MQIYGRNVVLTALELGYKFKNLNIAATVEGDAIKKIKRFVFKIDGLDIKWLPPQLIDKIAGAGNVHQGVVGEIEDFDYKQLEPFIEAKLKEKKDPVIVICDQITDPHNLGAIIRSADCSGADAVIIPSKHSADINTTVFKTSAGSAFNLPVIKVDDLKITMDFLKKKKFGLFGLVGDAETSFSELHYENPTALIIGNEGIGIRKMIRNNCDELIKIPIYGKGESLNASVASAVVLYHIAEKRNSK